MQHRSARFSVAAFLAAIMLLLMSGIASAHEHRTVGDYELTVGFSGEPALVDEPNGLDLRVQKGEGDNGTPVEGLDATLKAEIIYGDQSKPLEIRAKFGQPGAYTADLIPTKTGAYTFHITGTIEGTPVDESFTSGPDTFSEVAGKDSISFPEASSDSSSSDDADSAKTLAIVGIVVGALGLIAGLAGVAMARGSAGRSTNPDGAIDTGDQG
jgi:hypothetical protein